MRILFISAFYPPHEIGGWEQLVRDINIRLQARGHITQILTSEYRVSAEGTRDGNALRLLTLESNLVHYRPLDFFLKWQGRVERNLATVQQTVAGFNPDVIFIHGMWNLSRGIPWKAENLLPSRVVYYVANNWPYVPDVHSAYWRDPAHGLPQQLVKRLLAPVALRRVQKQRDRFPLRFERVLCVSQAMRQELAVEARIPLDCMQVVYNGVETGLFTPVARDVHTGQLALLYAGTLAEHKGVHTAVEALARIAHRPGLDGITLTLVGSGHPDYEARLRQMVSEAGLGERVHFLGRVDREAMPELLRRFDALVFPSVWQEPLARITQEAMSAGLVVVGTLTGGTPEILLEGQTGLTFDPGDSAGLADRLEQLARDPALRERLADNARQLMLEKFDLDRMVDEIETYLCQTVEADAAAVLD